MLSTLLLLAVMLVHLSCSQAAPVMAVDLGSEFLKVSVVKSGKIPIATVLNEASKRKTAAEVTI